MSRERVSFLDLRRLKDSLPHGALGEIARELGLRESEVLAAFAGSPEAGADPRCAPHVERVGGAGAWLEFSDNALLAAARRRAGDSGGAPGQ